MYPWSPDPPGRTYRTHGEQTATEGLRLLVGFLLHCKTVLWLREIGGMEGGGKGGFLASDENKVATETAFDTICAAWSILCMGRNVVNFCFEMSHLFYLPGQNHDNSVWKHWWKVCKLFSST